MTIQQSIIYYLECKCVAYTESMLATWENAIAPYDPKAVKEAVMLEVKTEGYPELAKVIRHLEVSPEREALDAWSYALKVIGSQGDLSGKVFKEEPILMNAINESGGFHNLRMGINQREQKRTFLSIYKDTLKAQNETLKITGGENG